MHALQMSGFVVARLGLSSVAPSPRMRDRDSGEKVPDLLIWDRAAVTSSELSALEAVGFDLRPEVAPAQSADVATGLPAINGALAGIEIEFSPYRARDMKGRHWAPPSIEALRRRPRKHAKAPIAPNIFIKEEDLVPLEAWSRRTGVPVVVLHVFDQEAFAVMLTDISRFKSRLEREDSDQAKRDLQISSGIFREIQTYDRSDAQGAAERKAVFKVSPSASVLAGTVADVEVCASLDVAPSQKYVSQVVFRGGQLVTSQQFRSWLASLRHE